MSADGAAQNADALQAYCPACSGHGTNVHECAEQLSAVVRAADLRHVLDVMLDNGMVEAEDQDVYERLWAAIQ
jgi:hypothetical protein